MKVKIRLKLTVIMVVLSLIGIGAVSIILLNQARTNIEDLAIKYTLGLGEKGASNVKAYLEDHWASVETLANVMEQYNGIIVSNRRNYLNLTLRGLLESMPEVIGIWCAWEEDALEGNDRAYIGTPGTNSSGRFVPYYYWDNGRVRMVLWRAEYMMCPEPATAILYPRGTTRQRF